MQSIDINLLKLAMELLIKLETIDNAAIFVFDSEQEDIICLDLNNDEIGRIGY